MPRGFAFLLSCLLPASALAAGPGEMSLSAGPGLALTFDSQTRAGAAADARFLYGLSDSWSARLGLLQMYSWTQQEHMLGRMSRKYFRDWGCRTRHLPNPARATLDTAPVIGHRTCLNEHG